VEAISDLPMLHDIDADYSPQYVKLARIIRGKIESGEYKRMDALPAAGLADAYGVSMQVAYAALAMLGANRYVSRVRSQVLPRHLGRRARSPPGADERSRRRHLTQAAWRTAARRRLNSRGPYESRLASRLAVDSLRNASASRTGRPGPITP